jgi:hypothetical protein
MNMLELFLSQVVSTVADQSIGGQQVRLTTARKGDFMEWFAALQRPQASQADYMETHEGRRPG